MPWAIPAEARPSDGGDRQIPDRLVEQQDGKVHDRRRRRMSAAEAAVAAGAAARAAAEARREEEDMTTYTPQDLAENWEFKILRGAIGGFREPERLRAHSRGLAPAI